MWIKPEEIISDQSVIVENINGKVENDHIV